jgi:hypothetical protein
VLLALATSSTSAFAGRTQKASRDELCARAIAEVEASRVLVQDLDARLSTAREQLAALEARIRLDDERATVEADRARLLKEQVSALEQEISLARDFQKVLEADAARLKRERDNARRSRNVWGLVGFAAGVVLAVLATNGGT